MICVPPMPRRSSRIKMSRSSARTARSARNRCCPFSGHSPASTICGSAACPTPASPNAKAIASSIRNHRLNILRCSRAKPPLSACAFSAAAAAPRPRTSAPWPKRSNRCIPVNAASGAQATAVAAKPAPVDRARARKQILEKVAAQGIHSLRGDRPAKGPFARSHLRAGR